MLLSLIVQYTETSSAFLLAEHGKLQCHIDLQFHATYYAQSDKQVMNIKCFPKNKTKTAT